MEHHQRHSRGNAIIIETMSRYFRMPSGLRETLYLLSKSSRPGQSGPQSTTGEACARGAWVRCTGN